MKRNLSRRLLSVLLAVLLVFGMVLPALAVDTGKESLKFERVTGDSSLKTPADVEDAEGEDLDSLYDEYDTVRVSIVLEEEATIERFDVENIAYNVSAKQYREKLETEQKVLAEKISVDVLDNEELDVVWNLTLAANIISANVRYGQIEEIKNVPGVKDVFVETRYEPMVVNKNETANPNMATSSEQIGSGTAWAAGYTGAGSKVAVIDTGIDTEHISFDGAALEYSLGEIAKAKGIDVDKYIASLKLLTPEKIDELSDQLNAPVTGAQAYRNTKIAFGYNYIDGDLDITHLNDTAGEHGSHVEGIAAANAYVPNGDGTFDLALKKVFVQGVAPDAQIVTMKVFGKGGGAYDSDYMVAIEDAIILGCDSVNLSLGSGSAGFSRSNGYEEIMASLVERGTVVCISAGNSGGYADHSIMQQQYGLAYLFGDDVSMHTGGSPGSFTNALTVASVDNSGGTMAYIEVAGNKIGYSDTSASYTNEAFTTLAGEREYVFIDGTGTEADWAALGDAIKGKIAICSRGEISFYEKAENAAKAGAIGTIIYNHEAGTINMDLSSYTRKEPAVSITQADGALIRANSTAATTDAGVTYYTGTMTVSEGLSIIQGSSEYYTMSSFSSWGVPGSLELKPEITAPGGSIYSVWGANKSSDSPQTAHDQYEQMSGTSMASPQVAGMAAVLGQYIRDTGLVAKTGKTARQLINSLLMSTAEPVMEGENGGYYYSVLRQGAGLGNVGNAIAANAYIMMDDNLSGTAADGKVKAELGDDPGKLGKYQIGFTINNFSDEDASYDIDADFFTQDIFTGFGIGDLWLDTWTTPIDVTVTYTVDGEEYTPVSRLECDVDGDGDTDAFDADMILDYVAGKIDSIDTDVADVSGDGVVSTYDAYLILANAALKGVEVKAGESTHVVLDVVLSEDTMAYFDALYKNGAYIEGFIKVTSVPNEEGVKYADHSIPVLGFYGNWSDASMYERLTYVDYLFDNYIFPSYSGVANTNYQIIRYDGDKTDYAMLGNPCGIDMEEAFPADRLAANSSTLFYQQKLTLIRNAAALAAFMMNEDGEVVWVGPVQNQITSQYYYSNGGTWSNTLATLTVNTAFSKAGVKEGGKVTAGVVSIPEYYCRAGVPTAEEVAALIENGTLGHGAFLANTYTIDNTAPELGSVQKDLSNGNNGNLTITVTDNEYVAYAVVTKGQSLNMNKILWEGKPEQNEAGETVEVFVDLEGKIAGEYITIALIDYAGNESHFKVRYGGDPENFSGRMFGFTAMNYRGTGNRWMEITPSTLYYYSASENEGTQTAVSTDVTVLAADYVNGYVFMAANDGYIYAADQQDVDVVSKVGHWDTYTTNVYDMAYNTADGKLYALGANNTVYSVDTLTGEMTLEYTVAIKNPRSSTATYLNLTAMTIDDEGNFYAVNYGTSTYTYLYTWTNDTAVDGAITALNPINNASSGNTGYYSYYGGSLAYDHDADVIYWANAGSTSATTGSTYTYLLTLDTSTGKAAKANATYAGTRTASYASRLYVKVSGLYIVPASAISGPGGASVTAVEISPATGNATGGATVELYKGSEITLVADVYPWVLENKDVTWTTSDASVATVNKNGVVKAVGSGTAEITATSVADPSVSGSVTVEVLLPNVTIFGVLQDAQGNPLIYGWNLDTMDTWESLASIKTDVASVAWNWLDDTKPLYVQNSSAYMHKIDVSTGETLESVGENAFGAAMWDMDFSFYNNSISGVDTAYGLWAYGSYAYFLYSDGPMANTFSRGWNLYSFLQNYSKATKFVGLTWGGVDANEDDDHKEDTLWALDNAGYFWIIQPTTDATTGVTTGNASFSYIKSDLVIDYTDASDDPQYCSLQYDDDLDKLYFLHFTGETSEIYVLEFSSEAKMFVSTKLGDFGADVWPATIFMASPNTSSASAASVGASAVQSKSNMNALAAYATPVAENVAAEAIPEEVLAMMMAPAGSLNSVKAESEQDKCSSGDNAVAPTKIDVTPATTTNYVVTVNLTEDVPVTNGLVKVEYDTSVLTYSALASTIAHKSVVVDENNGTIVFAYASAEEITSTLASIDFTYTAEVFDTTVKVTTIERNDEVALGEVSELRIREDNGSHKWVLVNTVQPTCEDEGTNYYECAHCGATRTTSIAALGHIRRVRNESAVYTGDVYCWRCNKILEVGEYKPLLPFPIIPPVKDVPTTLPDDKPVDEKPVDEEPGDNVDLPAEEGLPFIDVAADASYYDAVAYLYAAGLMKGTSETEFSPEYTLNRATVVTILYRLEGEPEVEDAATFTDVNPDEWYGKAVAWAASVGIVNGYGDDTFGPKKNVTNEQLAAIIVRYAKYKGIEIAEMTELPEGTNVSDWAVADVAWAANEGILGVAQATDAKAYANRAEVAVAIYTYIIKNAQ